MPGIHPAIQWDASGKRTIVFFLGYDKIGKEKKLNFRRDYDAGKYCHPRRAGK